MQPMVDRRRFPRMKLDHPVSMVDVTTGERFVGVARSLSGNGLRFEVGTRIEPGRRLEITLTPPMALTEPLRALLEIVRCDPGGTQLAFTGAGRFARLPS